jgi:glycerol uptake facilitator-like aquaporin
MTSPILGEFLGTMMLVLLGNGVVAGVLLKRSKAEGGGWPVIAAGWAFAVMAGVFTPIACGSSDAHLNPAVTLGFAARSGDFARVAPYLAAQLLGGILGATLVWLRAKEAPTGLTRQYPSSGRSWAVRLPACFCALFLSSKEMHAARRGVRGGLFLQRYGIGPILRRLLIQQID